MGAGCSGNKVAAQIQEGAIKKKSDEFSKQAKEDFNMIRNDDPLSDSLNASALQSTLKKFKMGGKRDENVEDRDRSGFQGSGERMHEPLWKAIEANDLKGADKFLALNEIQEQNLYDQQGQSMIHRAAQLGSVEMVMLLLEQTGAKPDLVNSGLATPLHLACRANKESVVKFLIGCGGDVNMQDEHGQTPLLICCIHGFGELASLLIESSIAGHLPEPLEVNCADHRGLTPLNCAAIKGDLNIVKILCSRGQADVNQISPKGCTPLMYAGRGGYSEVVRYLLEKKASPLKQDNAGGTVFHHCIEKAHIQVLEVMLEHGVDVFSAIEIADNAGRTPLFEAVEIQTIPDDSGDEEQKLDGSIGQTTLNMNKPITESQICDMIKILTNKKSSQSQGGFAVKINVLNYSGQTPLFAAVKTGNFSAVKTLVECGAQVDLNRGELMKEEEQEEAVAETDPSESVHEKCFMEAFMNCMTPLQIAAVLGYDDIALYLIDKGADVNLQTNIKRYTALHLAVLSNKPEMLIELLTKSRANPLLEDSQGRSLLDMVYQYNPTYVDSFQVLLENLSVQRMQEAGEMEKAGASVVVARHYVNPDDEREITGVQDEDKIRSLYRNHAAFDLKSGTEEAGEQQNTRRVLADIDENDIDIDQDGELHGRVEAVFGRKVAIALIAADWKIKEMAIKHIYKKFEKAMGKNELNMDLNELVQAAVAAVSVTSRERVIKVFNVSLLLFHSLITSSKIDQDLSAADTFIKTMETEELVPKLLLKSEESNTRLTNKIHEALLDLSYHPKVGEDLVAQAILDQISLIYSKNQTGYKGLLAQLALLFKMINSFGIAIPTQLDDSDPSLIPPSKSVLTVESVLEAAIPSITHTNQDVKNAAIKIVLDVQRLTGAVKDSHFKDVPERTKEMMMEKVFQVQCETEFNQTKKAGTSTKGVFDALGQMQEAAKELKIVNIGGDFNPEAQVESEAKQREVLGKNTAIIFENGEHKEWGQREIALQAIQETFEIVQIPVLKENHDFIGHCIKIIKNSLDDNNIQIYLVAIQVASCVLQKGLSLEMVTESLASILKSVVLKSTDTNTRVRKKSMDLVFQVWDFNSSKVQWPSQAQQSTNQKLQNEQMISSIIADVICDSSLLDKAIQGRLTLFIKKAMMIESGEDLNKKSHKHIMGRDYEQLTEFACQWCLHKNTKVRQGALKLIVEVCRMNYIDPRGFPFKQRIINFILGLRPSLRDPLVIKINEVCAQEQKVDQDAKVQSKDREPFINISEMELNLATKVSRATSLDPRRGREQVRQGKGQAVLPSIGVSGGSGDSEGISLPGLAVAQGTAPTIVLPHSEPLSEEQLTSAEILISLFNKEIVTCFYSQTWSSRQAAIQKIEEQLHNLDPNRRDVMYGEINRQNFPPEVSFRTFLYFISEGLKDPVLKNYLLLLDLIQKVLPIYFRYMRPEQIREDLIPQVANILAKTSDLKSKVREATINFCLYLSHQSPIGPEVMITQVLSELEPILVIDKNNINLKDKAPTSAFGNSTMIASCLTLLTQFQQQTKLVDTSDSVLYKRYLGCINFALKHTNPQVRKQAELLVLVLYTHFQEQVIDDLKEQKPAVIQKIRQEAKQASIQDSQSSFQQNATAQGMSATSSSLKRQTSTANQDGSTDPSQTLLVQKTIMQLKDDVLNSQSLKALLGQQAEELTQQLKLPNGKKRLRAIIEIKKVIQKKTSTLNEAQARQMLEPLQILLRELLRDDNSDVFIEALNLLKFVVGTLAPQLSSLDLHLMIGQFIGLTISTTNSHNSGASNMRHRLASDKVIIYFAKHSSIGSFVVAREVLKNIERMNRAIQTPFPSSFTQKEIEEEGRQRVDGLVRNYNVLSMLLQQFSIVLCYQPDFYVKCLEHLAETLIICQDDPALRLTCTQIVQSLGQIDSKLLESGVAKLDFTKKTPLRKIMIEQQNQLLRGKNVMQVINASEIATGVVGTSQTLIANAAESTRSPDQSFRDTQQSFTSLATNQGGLPSGSNVMRLRRSRDSEISSSHQKWSERQGGSEIRSKRNTVYDINSSGRFRNDMGGTGQSWLAQQDYSAAGQKTQTEGFLPDINNNSGSNMRRRLNFEHQNQTSSLHHQQSRGGINRAAGFNSNDVSNPLSSIQPTSESIGSPLKQGRRASQKMAGSGIGGQDNPNRPPLYVPTKREPNQMRASGTSFNSSQQQQPSQHSEYKPKTEFTSSGYNPSIFDNKKPPLQSSLFGGGTGASVNTPTNSRVQPSQGMYAGSGFTSQKPPTFGGGGGAAGYSPKAALKPSLQSTSSGMGSDLPIKHSFNSSVEPKMMKTVPAAASTTSANASAASTSTAMPPRPPQQAQASAPAQATFKVKQSDYVVNKKKNEPKRPDILDF